MGALVQANYGRRERLAIDGVPVGREIGFDEVPSDREEAARLGRRRRCRLDHRRPRHRRPAVAAPVRAAGATSRAWAWPARGGAGEHSSGDLFIAFATGNRGLATADRAAGRAFIRELRALEDAWISPLFWAAIESTEEAIVNALVAAETMTGAERPRRLPLATRPPRRGLAQASRLTLLARAVPIVG